MAFALDIRPIFGKYPRIESLDDRFDKHISLKEAYRYLLPTKADGTPDFASKAMPILPNSMIWKDSAGRAAPDFDQSPWINVSAKAKAIIESAEPDVHEFAPVAYTYSRGATEIRFWINVRNRVDSIDGIRSNMVLSNGQWLPPRDLLRNGEPLPHGIDPEIPPNLVFRSEAVGPFHMWVDPYLSNSSVFISDALAERFRAGNITGLAWESAKVEEV